jgi:hypothetical protein
MTTIMYMCMVYALYFFNIIFTGGLPKTSGLRVASLLEAQGIRTCI